MRKYQQIDVYIYQCVDMNMFTRFDEIPAMTLQILRKQNITDIWMDIQCENSIPSTNAVWGGVNTHMDLNIGDIVSEVMKGKIES